MIGKRQKNTQDLISSRKIIIFAEEITNIKVMNIFRRILKPFVPILATIYGFSLIYVTAIPIADGNFTLGREALSWMLTLAAIGLTYIIAYWLEPKVFPESKQLSMKLPKLTVVAGLLLLAPLWLVVEGYLVYGLTSLIHSVRLESITYTPDELSEDLLAGVHAVLLAPVLEELCFRQLAISPFRQRKSKIIVCAVMALFFGILHVRNFIGASIGAMLFGLVFIWTRNIWYAIILHMGRNLTITLVAIYCMLGLGEIRMSSTPVIYLFDAKVVFATVVMAVIGFIMLKKTSQHRSVNLEP